MGRKLTSTNRADILSKYMQDRLRHHSYLINQVSQNFRHGDVWWRKKREHEIKSIYCILQTSTLGNWSKTFITAKIYILWRGSCGFAKYTSRSPLQASIDFLKKKTETVAFWRLSRWNLT